MEIFQVKIMSLSLLYRIASEFVHQIKSFSDGKYQIGKGIFIIDLIGTNRKIKMSDITSKLNIPASSATRMVNDLLKENLVERTEERKEEDRRIVNLKLKSEGEKLFNYFQTHQRNFEKALLQDFTTEEIATAFRVLHGIVEKRDELMQI